MLNYVKNLLGKLFRKKSIITLYHIIKKRPRRSYKRDDTAKFGDPISKYNKYH